MRRGAGPAAGAALAAAFVLAAALGTQPLSHDDLFWHLRAGEMMLEEGRVLTTDPFSYTLPGARWVTHEWGFSVLLAALAGVVGIEPLIALRGVLVVVFFAGVALAAWWRAQGAPAPGAPTNPGAPTDPGAPPDPRWALPLLALLLAAAAWAVSRELILRAALPGAVLFASLALLLHSFRRRPTGGRGAAIVALVLVWANLHSGVIFGLFLLALAAAEALVFARLVFARPAFAAPAVAMPALAQRPVHWRRRLAGARPQLALLAAAALASLANPNGIETPLYPFRLALLLGDPASGFDLGHFAGGWRGRQAILGLLVAVLAGGLLRAVRRRRPLPSPAEIAAVAVFAALSWGSARLALELVALAVPMVLALWAPRLGGADEDAGDRRRRWAPAAASLTVAAASVLLAALVVAARPAGTLSPAFPSAAAAWLERNGLAERRLFHHQNWGGYLGWRLGVPVFWDGRNDVFAPLVREVTTTPFPIVARRYGVEVLVLSPREVEDLAPLLGPDGDWAFAHHSGAAWIFVRRDLLPATRRDGTSG
jgi:hypothetical protein